MVSSLIAVVALALNPADVKLAAPGLNLVGLEKELADPLTEQLARGMAPVRVITARDISSLLGLERQKQLLGCGEVSTSCMAEMGAALGVDGVVLGDLTKAGGAVRINLKVLDPKDGGTLATWSERVSDADAAFDAMTRGGAALREALAVRWNLPTLHSSSLRSMAWIPAAAGVVVGAVGAVCLASAQGIHARLTSSQPGAIAAADAPGLASEGSTYQLTGAALVGLGAAAVLAGAGFFLFGGPASDGTGHAALGVGVAPGGLVVWGVF